MNNDLISRSALLEKKTRMTEYDETGCGVHVYVVSAEDVETAPAVDAEPVRHGRWINKTEMRHGICDYRFDCSECGHIFWAAGVKNFNFCPTCGAKMDETT